jgi:hypothetical protein
MNQDIFRFKDRSSFWTTSKDIYLEDHVNVSGGFMNRQQMSVIVFISAVVLLAEVCTAPNAGNGAESSTNYTIGTVSESSSRTYNANIDTIYNAGSEPITRHSSVPKDANMLIAPSHPSIEPPSGNVPANAPAASTDSDIPIIYHGQNPPLDYLRKIGGNIPFEMNNSSSIKLQYYLLYNGLWCQNSTGYYFNKQTNSLMYVDRPQNIWVYEKYANSEVWKDLGFWEEGYRTGWFSADEPGGWHRLALYGNESGWSNVLWIYVW